MKLKEEYIFAHEPTEKQIEWLKKYDKYDSSISGYEAWHIINDAIEASKKARGISGNKVSTVNFMDLLQNPEVHQLHPFVFYINLTNKLLLEGNIN